MKKLSFVKIVAAVCVLAIAATCTVGCGNSSKSYTSKNTEYIIGCSGPLTGGAAIYGIAVQKSAQMAVDEINDEIEKTGNLNGVKFKFIMKDDQAATTNVATNFNSMFESGMQVSLGCVTSGSCLEYKKRALANNVFCLTPSATSDAVPQDAANMYQMCFSDSSQGTYAAQYIQESEDYAGKTVGVFYNNSDAYSTGIYDNFVAAFGKDNIKATATFTDDTSSDFAGQAQALKDCDLIFMPIYYTPASLFIKTLVSTYPENTANTVFFGCDGFDGIDGIEGFDVYSYSQEISFLSHFNAKSTDEATVNFVAAFSAKYPGEEKYINQFGASAYDSVYAIYNAMLEAGDKVSVTISAADLCKVLQDEFNNGFTYSGVTGTNITWSADGLVNKKATKYVVNEK